MAVALLCVIPVALTLPLALAGRVVLDGDDLDQNYPLRVLSGELIRHGHLPAWDPFIWSGTPLLAGWNAGSMFPATWLFAVFHPIAAWTIGLVLTYAASAVGCYALLRRLACAPLAATAGALAFTYGGFMGGQLIHIGLVQGTAMLPWLLLGLDGLALAGSWRAAVRPAVAVALATALIVLAGDPRAVSNAAIAGLIYVLVCCWRSPRRAWRMLAGTSMAAVAGAALSAVQWVAGFGFLHASQRGSGAFYQFGAGSIPLDQLAQALLLPHLLGGNVATGMALYKGPQNLPEMSMALGLLALVAALAYLPDVLRPRRRRGDAGDPAAWAAGRVGAAEAWRRLDPDTVIGRERLGVWYLMILAGALLAAGTTTPLGRVLQVIPLYDGERLQGRNSAILDMALAVLLAVFVDDVRRGRVAWTGRRLATALALLPPVAAVGLGAAVLIAPSPTLDTFGLLHRADTPAFMAHTYAYLGAMTVVSAAVAATVLLVWRGGGRRLVLAALVLDLATLLAGTPMTTVPDSWMASATADSSSVATLAGSGRYALYNPWIRNLLRDPGVLVRTALTDDNILHRVSSVGGYGSIVDGTYDAATDTHGLESLRSSGLADGTFDVLDLRALLTLPLYLDEAIPPHSAIPVAGGPPAPADGGTDVPTKAPNPSPMAAGPWTVAPSSLRNWRLPGTRRVLRVTVVVRGDAAPAPAKLSIGVASGVSARPPVLHTVPVVNGQAHLSLLSPVTGESVVVADPGRRPAVVGAVVAVTMHPDERLLLDGSLQGALPLGHWSYGGRLGALVVFLDNRAPGPAWLQPLDSPAPDPARRAPGTVRVIGARSVSPEVDVVTLPAPARLVRSETYEPGWTATVQPLPAGRPVEQRVTRFGLVQTVALPAGRYRVSWRYAPATLRVGALVSAASALALLTSGALAAALSLLGSSRRRRRRRHALWRDAREGRARRLRRGRDAPGDTDTGSPVPRAGAGRPGQSPARACLGRGGPLSAPAYRRVRVLCVDERGRLLLLRWRDPVSGTVFYEPPGGGIEPGETPADAALRELREETGLPGPISRHAVVVERRHTWKGVYRQEPEPFFMARYEMPEVSPAALTESESETLLGWRWAASDEDLGEPVEPPQVFEVLEQLRAADIERA